MRRSDTDRTAASTVSIFPLRLSFGFECSNNSRANFALQVDWKYYVAFGAVVVGLIIYAGYVIYFTLCKHEVAFSSQVAIEVDGCLSKTLV